MIHSFLIFFTLGLLCFYTKEFISTTRFKKKYNIKTNTSIVEIICHIIAYILGIINISICIWTLFALFNN